MMSRKQVSSLSSPKPTLNNTSPPLRLKHTYLFNFHATLVSVAHENGIYCNLPLSVNVISVKKNVLLYG